MSGSDDANVNNSSSETRNHADVDATNNDDVGSRESFGSASREKTTQWLEEVLATYFTFVRRKESQLPKEEAAEAIPLVTINVKDFDIGPGFPEGLGHLSTLSDLLSLKVWFQIEGDNPEEDKTENLIVKIPPNDLADREMAHLAQVDKREIHFYTEARVHLEEWAATRSQSLKLSVPKCYYAQYHAQPPRPTIAGSVYSETDAVVIPSPSIPEAESVLVLEDVRPLGYTMKDFSCGLTLEEAMAALREIAVVHSLSWSMQEISGQPLDQKWDFAYRPRKAASAYKMMIEQGFPTLCDFLSKQQPDGSELLQKLRTLHPKAVELLCELLEPPAPPLPSCLTHMDFWCNNLLFRKRADVGAGSNAQQSSGASGASCGSGSGSSTAEQVECQIVDWQMMAISRPTHDIALLLFTSLTPDVRQENTDKLLKYYWTVFQATAKKVGAEVPFGFDTIENEFRKSQLLALLLVIGSIDLALEFEATESRLMHALRDMAKQELI